MLYTIIALAFYLSLTIFTSLKITKSVLLSKQQKTFNIILNALIPLIWYYLVSPIIFQQDKVMTKSEREKLISKESGSKSGDETASFTDASYFD
jgi:hypothetical protein